MSKSGIGWAAMLAIAAMGSAQAVNLDINGRGQVLLYPYYTVNKGQQTLISVTKYHVSLAGGEGALSRRLQRSHRAGLQHLPVTFR